MKLATVLLLSLLISSTTSLDPAFIKGYKFFSQEQELVIRGIDYFPRPNFGIQSSPDNLNQNSVDLYTEEHRHVWERDIPFLKELNVNAIRLYAVDPNKDHSAFMCAMNQAGIYVLVALAHDCPTCAVTRDQAPDCYPVELKLQGQKVIDEFSKYPNTLAFSAGNEVNHFAPDHIPQWNAPCQKKFIRDMRQYIDSCDSIRKVPVGLVSADADRQELVEYYNCVDQHDNDSFEHAEWYGLNTYVFCDGNVTAYKDALGFRALEKSFHAFNYSIPVLLTEFGCLSDSFATIGQYEHQRNFYQAKWMLEEPTLRDLFSGGFAFEYSMENANDAPPYPFYKFGKSAYGIGYFSPEKCTEIDVPCQYHPLPSYYALRDAYSPPAVVSVPLSDFQVPESRSGRSSCPSSFPPLSNFTWKTDRTSLKCPRRPLFTKGPVMYNCPSGLEFGPVSISSRSAPLYLCIVLAVALAVTLTTLAYICLRRRQYEIIVPTKSEETTSLSSESAGLFSMKKYQYQAIESPLSSQSFEQP